MTAETAACIVEVIDDDENVIIAFIPLAVVVVDATIITVNDINDHVIGTSSTSSTSSRTTSTSSATSMMMEKP